MRDNALDDAIFMDYVEKHRLADWLTAAENAAAQALQEEQEQRQLQSEGAEEADEEVDEDVQESVEGVPEYYEEEDVEMQDS
jgi:hypothetical protein